MAEEMKARAVSRGDTIARGPAPINYSGATGGGYSGVHNRAMAVLTNTHFIMQTGLGKPPMEIAGAAIADVRIEKWFRSSATASRTHVVLRMREGFEIGFSTPPEDAATWVRDIVNIAGR